MNILNGIRENKKEIGAIAIIALTGIVSLFWFKKGLLLWGDDTYVPLHLPSYLRDNIHLVPWKIAFSAPDSTKFCFLMPLGLLLSILRLLHLPYSPIWFERIVIYAVFTGSGISAYYLFKTVFPNTRSWARILAGLFYMFNIYSFFLWHSFPWLVFFYAFIPLILALFIKGIDQEKGAIYFIGLALLWTFLLTPSYMTTPFALITWSLLALYLVFYILSTSGFKKIKKAILSTSALAVSWILLNLFWLVPLLFFYKSEYVKRAVGEDPLNLVKYNSTTLTETFRFLPPHHFSDVYKGVPFYPWFHHYGSNLFIFIGLCLVIMVFSAFLYKNKDKNLLFFGALILIFIFLVTGFFSPIKYLSQKIYGSSLVAATFRTVWQRFMGVVFLAAAVLLAYAADRLGGIISKRSSRKLLLTTLVSLVFVGFIGVYAFPFWIDQVFPEREGVLVSEKIKIPPSYYEAAEWLNDQDGDFVSLPLPYPKVGPMSLSWEEGRRGFWGIYPLMMLSEQRFLIVQPGNDLGSWLAQSILDGSFKSAGILGMYNVRYVIMHNDANWEFIEGHDWFVSRSSEEIKESLTSMKGLKKEVSFGDIDIYRNDYWDPNGYVFADSSLMSVEDMGAIHDRTDLADYILQGDYGFLVDTAGDNLGDLVLDGRSVFTDIGSNDIDLWKGIIEKKIDIKDPEKDYAAFIDHLSFLTCGVEDGRINFTGAPPLDRYALLLNGEQINTNMNSSPILLGSIIMDDSSRYFLSCNGRIVPLTEGLRLNLGKVKDCSDTVIYAADQHNLIANPSFEEGLWQEKPIDCNQIDENSIMDMKINNDMATDGSASLQIEATTHIAGTYSDVALEGGKEYVLGFDYRSTNAVLAGYYLGFNDVARTTIIKKIPIEGEGWGHYSERIETPPDATSARLCLYAYSQDDKENVINLYDNVWLSEIKDAKTMDFTGSEHVLEKIPVKVFEGENNLALIVQDYRFHNLIANPSFEEGLWQEKPIDCNQIDENSIMDMKINNDMATDGSASLQIEATTHLAGTYAKVLLKGGENYILGFDYHSPNAENAGFSLTFDDAARTTINEKIPIKGEGWEHYSERIEAPSGATLATLYLYAYSQDNEQNVVNLYDNISFSRSPLPASYFYLVGRPHQALKIPRSIEVESVNPTKKVVHIRSASTSFFMGMEEAYHAGWRIKPGGLGDGGPNDNHFTMNCYVNGWYIDLDYLKDRGLCVLNEDGTYDIDLVIEFAPQRYIYLTFLISASAILACIVFLVWKKIADKQREKNE